MPQSGRKHGKGENARDRTGTFVGSDELIDLANDAIIVRELANGTILRWSLGAEKLYGWAAAEAFGKAAHSLLQTEFPVPFQTIRDTMLAQGRWDGELIHRARDGKTVVVASRWALRQTKDMQPPVLLEINTDITERKQAEEALHRTEERLRNLLETAPDAIMTVDADGRIVFANSQTSTLFGYSHVELLNLLVDELVPSHFNTHHAQHRAIYNGEPHTRPMGIGLDLFGLRKDGSTFPVEISLSPLESEGRQLVTAVIRDVSERIMAEAAWLRAEAAEHAVKQRDEFLSVAAHELKTPLTSLLGFTEALLRLHEKGSNPDIVQVKRALQTIAKQSGKLNRLVSQLLDLSSIDAGNMQLERRLTDLVPIIARATEVARTRATMHVITVNAPERYPAVVDSLRFEQVMTNLLENAVRYSPSGGQITIEVSTCERGNTRIVVRDQGIGIPEPDRAHIFDRYYQAHVKSHRSGIGLGLYISRQIVDMHGGQIEARFPLEGGTEIIFTLAGAGAPAGM